MSDKPELPSQTVARLKAEGQKAEIDDTIKSQAAELARLEAENTELRAQISGARTATDDMRKEAEKWSELHRDELRRRVEVEARLEVKEAHAELTIKGLHSTINILSSEMHQIREQWNELMELNKETTS